MAITINHATVAAVADDGVSPIGSDDWNAAFDTSVATQRLVGRTTAGAGSFEEIDVDVGLDLVAGSGALSFDDSHRLLTANGAYTNSNSAQSWFASSGAVAVVAGTTYFFEGLLLQTNGTTSHTVGLSFAGTATLTDIAYICVSSAGAVNSTVAAQNTTMVTQASNTVVTAAITTAGTQIYVRGLSTVNAAGTLIPQFTFSVAPGAGNVLANTFFSLTPVAALDTSTSVPFFESFASIIRWSFESSPVSAGYVAGPDPGVGSLVSGGLQISTGTPAGDHAYPNAYIQLSGFTPGNTYNATADVTSNTGTVVIRVYSTHPFSNPDILVEGGVNTSSGAFNVSFVAPGTTAYISIIVYSEAANSSAIIDNVSVS